MPVWKVLARGTPKVSPSTISNASSLKKAYDLNLDYSKGVKTLTFYGKIKSSSTPGSYSLMISFKGISEHEGLTKKEIEKGFKPKPTLGKHEILIRCSCKSYRFRFDYANRKHKVGTGPRFGHWKRKTNRKPNNPGNIPGFCKHSLEFVEYLQRQGFIL